MTHAVDPSGRGVIVSATETIPELWVVQAARPIARAYSTWTTLDDVQQSIWVWVHSNQERIAEYLARPDGERIIRSVLSQEGRNYANKERAAMSGYEFDDVAWYTPTALKRILPDVFDYMDWTDAQSRGAGNNPAGWSGDRLATLIDVKRAVESLAPDRQELMRQHYGYGITLSDCAKLFGRKEDTVKKQIQRALSAMNKFLNDPRVSDPMEGATLEEWRRNQRFYDTRTRGRKAISNAAARAATDAGWGE